MAEKLKEKLSPAWEKLHAKSAARLLRAEAHTLGLLDRAIRSEVGLIVADLLGMDRRLGESFIRRRAILSVRRSIDALGLSVAAAVREGRAKAREASYAQLVSELRQVRTELELAAVPPEEHPDDPPATEDSEVPKDDEDAAAAHAVGTSFAAAWGHRALTKVLAWADDPSGSLAAQVRKTIGETDAKVRQIATTETARAYSDEHDEGVGYVAEQHEASTWLAGVFKVWNAVLDRATCPTCAGHDGEVVLIGFDFDGGDEPGDIHPNCRCVSSLMVIPAMIPGGTTPGHYDPEEEEDAA